MTGIEMALLTLLAEAPRHGYEIDQVIETRGMREWTEIGFSSIYYVLKKLQKAGLVDSQLAPASRSAGRKVYAITPEGRAALQTAALDALSVPKPVHSPFQLGLANLPELDPAAVQHALHQYRATLDERLAQLAERRALQHPLPPHVEAMFDFSQHQIAAERRWVDRYLTALEGENASQT